MEQVAAAAAEARTLRVLIAGAESQSRDTLRCLLSRTLGTIVVGEASTAQETIGRVAIGRPDVVLLDIRIPTFDGLRIAERLSLTGGGDTGGGLPPKIVFIAARGEFAVRAFELHAIDYLLEPVDAGRLDAALTRVRTQLELEHRPRGAAFDALLERLQAPASTSSPGAGSGFLDRVCVQSNGRIQIVRLADVEWIEACGNYARLHTTSGRPMLRETLRHLLTQLDPARFARVHRSAIVALDRIREMRSCATGDYVIELTSGTRLRLSRSYRADVDGRLRRRA